MVTGAFFEIVWSAPAVSEVLAAQGVDWLFLDAEHGPLKTAELLAILQTAGDRVPCLVRVAAAGEVFVKKALDLGAAGIIVPLVNTVEQAAAVVRWSRYSPDGARGVGLSRAQGYGASFAEYLPSANESIVVGVQAEHIDAVDNIASIVQVPGIDAVLIGPYDLSASLGKMGQVTDSEVTSAIDRVTQACRKAEVPMGIFLVSADAVKPWIERGFTLVVAGVDTSLPGEAAGRLLSELRT